MGTSFSDVNAAKLPVRQVRRVSTYISLSSFAGGTHLQSWFAEVQCLLQETESIAIQKK
jgi:hypothetical protein